MTSNHHAPYGLAYTRTNNGGHRGQRLCKEERIPKKPSSSDRSLQPDSVKMESLVIADQPAAVNTSRALYNTARQTMGVGNAGKPVAQPEKGASRRRQGDDWG